MEQVSNTVWMRGYTADGFQVSLTLGLDATPETINQLLAKVRMAGQAGLMPSAPGLNPGEDKEAIATCIRRASASGVPIIDFYPAWGFEGQFGEHKYAHLYLNTPADIAQFEAQSGLRLADMPLRDEPTALKRTFGKTHAHEVAVKRSFEMLRTPDGQYETGMPKWRYSYFKELPIAPVNPPAPAPSSTPDKNTSSPQPTATPKVNTPSATADIANPDGTVNPTKFFGEALLRGVTSQQILARLGVPSLGGVSASRALEVLNDYAPVGGEQAPLGTSGAGRTK